MISLDFMEKVDIFNGLDQDRLAAVKDCCSEETFQQGEKLFDHGEDAKHLWVVVEGQIDLHFDPKVSSILGKNRISSLIETMPFGWSALVPPYKYRFSAYSAGPSKLIKVDKQRLTELCENDAELGYLIMSSLTRIIAGRFNQLQEELAKHRGDDIVHNW